MLRLKQEERKFRSGEGFLFGGKIYPSAEAASDVNLPKAGISLPKKESKPIKTILINKQTKVQ